MNIIFLALPQKLFLTLLKTIQDFLFLTSGGEGRGPKVQTRFTSEKMLFKKIGAFLFSHKMIHKKHIHCKINTFIIPRSLKIKQIVYLNGYDFV